MPDLPIAAGDERKDPAVWLGHFRCPQLLRDMPGHAGDVIHDLRLLEDVMVDALQNIAHRHPALREAHFVVSLMCPAPRMRTEEFSGHREVPDDHGCPALCAAIGSWTKRAARIADPGGMQDLERMPRLAFIGVYSRFNFRAARYPSEPPGDPEFLGLMRPPGAKSHWI